MIFYHYWFIGTPLTITNTKTGIVAILILLLLNIIGFFPLNLGAVLRTLRGNMLRKFTKLTVRCVIVLEINLTFVIVSVREQ